MLCYESKAERHCVVSLVTVYGAEGVREGAKGISGPAGQANGPLNCSQAVVDDRYRNLLFTATIAS